MPKKGKKGKKAAAEEATRLEAEKAAAEAVRRGVQRFSLILHSTPRLRGDTPSPRRRLDA